MHLLGMQMMMVMGLGMKIQQCCPVLNPMDMSLNDDCDDRDDDVYPQADELCNGEDDNWMNRSMKMQL